MTEARLSDFPCQAENRPKLYEIDSATFAGERVLVQRNVRCPVCKAESTKSSGDNLSVCHVCGHIFQTDLLTTISYDGAYAHQYDDRPVKEMSELRWKFIQTHLNLGRGSQILDVGYGNGAFLKRACHAGMQVFGIDVHSEDFGIPVVDFDTDLTFDLACFFDSIEHFANFDPIYNLRAHAVIVSVPNVPASLLANPKGWRHFKPGEHLHYFSRASLDKLMANWGFERKLAEGFPEDRIRGGIVIDGLTTHNIYTAIYVSRRLQSREAS